MLYDTSKYANDEPLDDNIEKIKTLSFIDNIEMIGKCKNFINDRYCNEPLFYVAIWLSLQGHCPTSRGVYQLPPTAIIAILKIYQLPPT